MTEIFDDIRQLYRFAPPCGELTQYIEFFSETAGEISDRVNAGQPFTVRMYPGWTPTIWLNLGTSYQLGLGTSIHSIGPSQDVLVLRDDQVTRYNEPRDHIFTIKFFPGALETLFGIRQRQFIDRIVDASGIIPPALIAQVKAAAGFDERRLLLDAWFESRLRRSAIARDHYTTLVRKSIGVYESSGMLLNTSQLAERMFVSSKTINRYFNDIVGLAPKKYFSLLRSRAALTAFVRSRADFDPCQFGYYDMSHFYREAAAFTGKRMG